MFSLTCYQKPSSNNLATLKTVKLKTAKSFLLHLFSPNILLNLRHFSTILLTSRIAVSLFTSLASLLSNNFLPFESIFNQTFFHHKIEVKSFTSTIVSHVTTSSTYISFNN